MQHSDTLLTYSTLQSLYCTRHTTLLLPTANDPTASSTIGNGTLSMEHLALQKHWQNWQLDCGRGTDRMQGRTMELYVWKWYYTHGFIPLHYTTQFWNCILNCILKYLFGLKFGDFMMFWAQLPSTEQHYSTFILCNCTNFCKDFLFLQRFLGTFDQTTQTWQTASALRTASFLPLACM
jgi:hypothetical protein